MKIDNIINLCDPRVRGKGFVFIPFGIYVFISYMTLELMNFRINISFERE